ncbi:MAG: hypothetical protein CMJ39_00550 [Phycisphaerae bacterium]|nr:hypothetical protein [Phycisphaerae bacterium]
MLRQCKDASAQFAQDLRRVETLTGREANHALNQALLTLRASLFGTITGAIDNLQDKENALRDMQTYLNYLNTPNAPHTCEEIDMFKQNAIQTLEKDLKLRL